MVTPNLAAKPRRKPIVNLILIISGATFACLGCFMLGWLGQAIGIIPAETPTSLSLSTSTQPVEVGSLNTPTELISPTVTLEPISFTDTPVPLAASTATVAACPPPGAPRQVGSVVEILDAANSRVVIDGLTYRVKYLGLMAPLPGTNYFEISKRKNAELTYTRPVTLVSGPVDKDAGGYLLRYVFAGETFVNLELLKLGYVARDPDEHLDDNCKIAYVAASDEALFSGVGVWAQGASFGSAQFFLSPTLRVYYVLPTETAIPPTASSVACCTYCGSNKLPCGNSCILPEDTCQKSSGCACK